MSEQAPATALYCISQGDKVDIGLYALSEHLEEDRRSRGSEVEYFEPRARP
jgi:hypothetical protein